LYPDWTVVQAFATEKEDFFGKTFLFPIKKLPVFSILPILVFSVSALQRYYDFPTRNVWGFFAVCQKRQRRRYENKSRKCNGAPEQEPQV